MLQEPLLPVAGGNSAGSIVPYFKEHIDPPEHSQGEKCKQIALNAILKASLLAVSAGGNAFFIPLSQKAAQSLNLPENAEKAAEVSFVLSNLAVVVALEFWCGIPIIEELLEKETVSSKAVGHQKLSKMQRALIGTAILGLALVSQASSAFAGMKHQDEEIKYYAAALILLRGVIWPVRSMHLKLKERLINARATPDEKILLKQQKKLLENLFASKEAFILSNKKETLIQNIESKVSEAIANGCQENDLKSYFTELFSVKTDLLDPLEKKEGIDYKAWGLFLGLVSIAGLEVGVTSDYVYDESKFQLLDDSVVAGLLAFLVFATNYDLTQEAIGGAIQKMFSTLSCQNTKKSLASQFHPKLTSTLKSVISFMDLLALGVSYVIWEESKQKSFNAFMCVATFLIFFAATDALTDSFLEEMMFRFGPDLEKKSVATSRRYDNVAKHIGNIAPKHLPELFDLLPSTFPKSSQVEELI